MGVIPAVRPQDSAGAWRALLWLLVALLALVVAHDVDHLVNQERQGGLVEGFWIFLPFQYAAFGLTLLLMRRRDPRAPAVAVLLGSLAVVAFIGAHVVPWGPQPFGDYDVPATSWILVFVPTAVAVGVVAAGLRLR
jgi:membrane-associated protease RseP (regulator of RpoE activity)